MIDFSHSAEITINASPQAIFDIVSNPDNHIELAGSDELKKMTQRPAGPVGLGTIFFAEETVVMGDGSTRELTADSVVVTFDPPKSFSWIAIPAFPEPVRRIQWWFRMIPEGNGTKVVHEIEGDWGTLTDEKLLDEINNYEQMRGGVVRSGMDKTVLNLKRMAER